MRAALDARVAGVSVSNVHWTDGAFVDLRAVAARSRDVGGRLVSAADSPALAEPRCFAPVQDSSLHLAPCALSAYNFGRYQVLGGGPFRCCGERRGLAPDETLEPGPGHPSPRAVKACFGIGISNPNLGLQDHVVT